MPENLICIGNRVLSEQGRDNWDSIFGCGCDVATLERVILMTKGGAEKWAAPEEVAYLEKKGWTKSQ